MRRLFPLMILAACASLAAPPYRNPVIGNPLRVTESIADPHVLKFNGEYYLYATGNPIVAWHSKDLVRWEKIGPVLRGGDAGAWNAADVWAPECTYRNGKFYLYYSATRRSPDWRVGEMARRVGVAVSDSPRGPFVDSGAPLTPNWGIDGHVFLDPDDGQEYMFYSFLDEPVGAGIVADRMLSPTRLAGKPSRVAHGSEPWEDKDGDNSNGSVRYTNEGPTVLKRNGRYYMMYSGGSWDLPSYALAYAASGTPPQGGLDGPGWPKVAPPILRSTRWVEAPGHNAVVKAPNNVDDICFYHARVVPFAGPGDRIAFADRLFWDHGRMRMDQPSLADLEPADAPAFRDLFDRPDGTLGAGWRTDGGAWSLGGEAAQTLTAGTARAYPRTAALSHYVFEANVRLPEGRRAGVIAYSGTDDELRVWLDPQNRTVAFERKAATLASVPLPAAFRAENWHQLIVTKNGSNFRADLDGVAVLSVQALPGAAGKTVPGLVAEGGRAAFDGITLTSSFEDSFDAPETDWSASGGLWQSETGALHQAAGGAGPFTAIKGDAGTSYEFTASVRWRDDDSVASMAGVVAAANERGESVIAGFNRNIWPLARFTVERLTDSSVKETRSVVLPRGFQYQAWHTIRAVRRGSAFSFYLDGQLMLAASFDLGPARPGLFTRGVRAAFDDCALKHTGDDGNLALDGSLESLAWEDDGRASEAGAWKLSGSARGEYCCAYTGTRRLAVRDGAGNAAQRVSGLAAGRYVLNAFVETSGDGAAAIAVETQGGKKQATASGPWQCVSVEFEVAQPGEAVTLLFSGSARNGLAAADNFYLYRR